MENTKINYKNIVVCLLVLILAIVTGVGTIKGFPGKIEYMTRDGLYQTPAAIPNNIKIIAVDEETLEALGPYSGWNRGVFADVIEKLNIDEDTKPFVIGMDFIFSGTNDSEEDERFAKVVGQCGNVVLASSVAFESYIYKDPSDNKYYLKNYVVNKGLPYDSLAENAEIGFTNAIFDDDGIVRNIYTKVVSSYEGKTEEFETFAYIIASKIMDLPDYDYKVQVAYTGNPGDFECIPMAKILDGTVPGQYFDDAVVLIGAYEEGMMDAYRVPIDYSKSMYGVEMQANYINALIKNKIIYEVNKWVQFLIAVVLVTLYGLLAFNRRVREAVLGLLAAIAGYLIVTVVVFKVTSHTMSILSIPIGLVATFLIALAYKYIEMQKRKAAEMQEMLFSMAEAMAEAIEGRTPYNANHTKNVAKRSVEMLDYINKMYKEKKTTMHFSKADKNQIYLAAMLHDVGKMDVPLEVMDKPTKLGSKEGPLRDRLTIITLKIKNDALNGRITQEEADERCEKIKVFTDKLGLFNCGKPLNDEEWAIVNGIAESKYVDEEGNETPYLTTEEIDDIHIKAGTLSDNERTIMQSHVVYTDKILSHMKFGDEFKDVRAMAANHHEVLNGRGYPKGLKAEELDTMTRILTIMDIYDSLIADDRPYKKPKPIPVAFDILDEEAEFGKVDKDLLAIAKEMYMPAKEPEKEENNSNS